MGREKIINNTIFWQIKMKKTTKKRNVEKIQRYTYFCYFLLVPGALFPTSDAVLYEYP